VLLFDDDAYKSVAGEEGNMVQVPAWGGSNGVEDPKCRVLEALVEAVEEVRLIVCVYVLGDANVLVLSILNSCVHNIPSCRSWEDWQWERTCAWPCRPSTAVLQQLR
jgi:hypothetical protein